MAGVAYRAQMYICVSRSLPPTETGHIAQPMLKQQRRYAGPEREQTGRQRTGVEIRLPTLLEQLQYPVRNLTSASLNVSAEPF